ncbi:MAG: NAD(P)-binding domain-containing protein, partial [Deltaproteobacteria bacterium]|nr:NAD(P)-binding domain-containing protein [Deltaproteobacteria bacterium]
MSLAERRIAFIGGGAMAEALAGGLIAGGIPAAQISIAEPRPERCAQLRERHGVAAGADYADAVRDSDLIVLAVKPG